MDHTYQLKVVAIMTAPRHEIVFARNYIEIALRNAGVPLNVSGGVFYGQCMQRALESVMANGADVAITVDFDSMFTADDVTRLLQKLVSYDHLDAVAAMQCRRGKRFPLMTIAGKTQQVIKGGEPFEVSTAHFGLTAIDLHKLKDVPKPWFFSQPDEKGEWSGDRIDDDIWFWRQWAASGLKVGMDPETRIGHLEEVVTFFDDKMNRQQISPNDWAEGAYMQSERKGTLVFVGANIGGETLNKLVERHERSILFEPQPFAAEKLRQTYKDNPRVEVVQSACGPKKHRATFRIYNELGLSSSLGTMTEQAVKAFHDFDLSQKDAIEVDIVNLFYWLKAHEIDEVETLITDAQGMDLTILQTLEPMISEGKIKYIEAEADGEGFRHYNGLPSNSETDAAAFMDQFDYSFQRKDGRLRVQPDLCWKVKEKEPCPI